MLIGIALFASWVSASGCPEASPLDAMLKAGHIVMLGEVHGTEQAPAAAVSLACRAAVLGVPVWLGLEMPIEDQPRVEVFLRTGDYGQLLAAPFWQRDSQDGRSSVAMLSALAKVRELTLDDLHINVFLFDAEHVDLDRNRQMAGRIEREREQHREAAFVILTGDLHARIRAALPRSTAWHLIQQADVVVHAIKLAANGGTMWGCLSPSAPCKTVALSARTDLREGAFRVFPERRDGFDAEWSLGRVTASPPAVERLRQPAAPLPASERSAVMLKTIEQAPAELSRLGAPYALVLPWTTLCGGTHTEVLHRADTIARALRADPRITVLVVNFDSIDNAADSQALRRLVAAHAPRIRVWNDRQSTLIRRLDAAERAKRPPGTFPDNVLAVFDFGVVDTTANVLFVDEFGGPMSDDSFVERVLRELKSAIH